jgi:hypothetical protein
LHGYDLAEGDGGLDVSAGGVDCAPRPVAASDAEILWVTGEIGPEDWDGLGGEVGAVGEAMGDAGLSVFGILVEREEKQQFCALQGSVISLQSTVHCSDTGFSYSASLS